MTRLARNIIYNLAGQLALLVLGLVSAKYIFTRLGSDVLGLIYFAIMINTLALAILQLGITATTIKEVAANEHDTAYVIRLVRSGTLFYWIAYVVAAIAILALTPWFVHSWIHLETTPPETAIRMLRILGIFALLAVPQAFYVSVFRGIQRMGVPNLIDVVTSAINQAGIVLIIWVSGDAELVVWWIGGISALRIVLWLAMIASAFGWRSLLPRWDASVIRKTRRFTLQMLALSLLATVQTQSDKFVIATMLPVGAFGVYALMYGTIARGSLLTSAVAQSAFPALSEFVAKGDRVALVEKYHRLQDLLCYGLVPLYALLAFGAFPLFTAVLGAPIAAALVVPSVLLAVGYYMNGMLNVPYYMALSTDRPDIVLRLNVLALFITLPVTVGLTWWLGFAGAAASWVWYHVFAFAYVIPKICRACIGIEPRAWFHHGFRVLAFAAITYGAAGLGIWLALAPSLLVLAIGYALATLAFGILSWRAIAVDSRTSLLAVLHSTRRTR